jgi:L-xylulokinase
MLAPAHDTERQGGGCVGITGALVGIDIGQTRTKAVVFDLGGRELSVAIDSTEANHPRPLWAERELEGMWERVSSTVRAALETAGEGVEILGVGVSGHSDGLYLVDAAGRSVRPAILATDARAKRYAAELASGTSGSRLLDLTGQLPMAASPSAIMRWLRDHEPAILDRSRWLLSSTDWLRLMLTGRVATDVTMAAAAFVSLQSQTWSHEALAVCDLEEVMPKLPPVVSSDAIAGAVTPAAARSTGLRPGTPVVAGAHDVDTGALGMGATTAGSVSLLLGTYAINQILSDAPIRDPRWQVRPFLRAGQWLHMSTSPAGAGCLDWAAASIGARAGARGADSAAAVAEAQAVESNLALPYFLPFVHGGPPGCPVGGTWLGLRGEHGRASMLHAVMEGVAFSHRAHMEALGTRMAVSSPIRVGGGGARSHVWTQLLCDTLGVALEVTESKEVSALGAGLLAGLGIGVYESVEHAVTATVRVGREHHPSAGRQGVLDVRYERYSEAVRVLGGLDLGPFEDPTRPNDRVQDS